MQIKYFQKSKNNTKDQNSDTDETSNLAQSLSHIILKPLNILQKNQITGGYTIPKSLIMNAQELFSHLSINISNILEIESSDLARQLSIVEFEYFSRVKTYEYLDQIWSSRLEKERSNSSVTLMQGKKIVNACSNTTKRTCNISKMIIHTNNVISYILNNLKN